jgi:hypothetical protein
MTAPSLTQLTSRPELLLAGLALTVLVLLWAVRRVRRIARSDRPDDALSNVVMLIGLGWSSEAVWELTGRAELPTSLRLLLFFVLETLLVLSMIRAKRAMRTLGHPGRSGRTAWIVASSMAAVGAAVASSFGEAVLRLLIPLLITLAWWDGLVGEGVRRREDASSWRWTPRRFLLWVGAIEPGERDVETVHRERLTQTMTRLEFRRRHGRERSREAVAAKLARLSLTADDEVIAEVQRRVGRATWFETTHPAEPVGQPQASLSAGVAASARARRVRHGKALRQVRVTHPRPVIVAAQVPDLDRRATQEIDDAIRVMKSGDSALSQRKIAHLLRTSDARVARVLRRSKAELPTQQINGNTPALVGAGTDEKEN